MPARPTQISKPKLLIGEGSEEILFFNALLSQLNITDVQVLEYGGKPGLGRFLKTLPQISGYREITSLGITRDADDSARSAFQSICSGLRNARLPVPNKLGEITTTTPQISILNISKNRTKS